MIRVNDLWPSARERTPRRFLLVTLPAWGSLASMVARWRGVASPPGDTAPPFPGAPS